MILKHPLPFEICARDVCEKFVYKHSEIIDYLKKQPTFSDIFKLHVQITREFLGLGMRNFQSGAFV